MIKKMVNEPGAALLCHVLNNVAKRLHSGNAITAAEILLALDNLRYDAAEQTVKYPMVLHDLHAVSPLFEGIETYFHFEPAGK